MNRSNAHLYLPLVQALAAGHLIQANRKGDSSDDNWVTLEADDGEVKFTCAPELYRVQPVTALAAPAAGTRQREALRESLAWHEHADKALSKSGRSDADYYYRRDQHWQEIERINGALAASAAAPREAGRVDEAPAVLEALRRFDETATDDGSTDLPDAKLDALVAFGYLRQAGRSRYETTDAAMALLYPTATLPATEAACEARGEDGR